MFLISFSISHPAFVMHFSTNQKPPPKAATQGPARSTSSIAAEPWRMWCGRPGGGDGKLIFFFSWENGWGQLHGVV